MHESAAAHLGRNLRELREERSLSQQRAAERAGIPRATWTNLESGAANPTLAVLMRAAAALEVTLDELLAPPRAECRLYRSDELTSQARGAVTVRHLLPHPVPGLHVERLTVPAGAWMKGAPHTRGTREYLVCERGQLELATAGQRFVLDAGDVLVFPGDRRHGYHNPGDSEAVGISVIVTSS